MTVEGALSIGGYVLAGGASSRMGTDKALLELGGRPLIEHALSKLESFCIDVHLLSSNAELARYAPLVPDLHSGCGPLGGIEAALAHSKWPWNLIMAVDLPFVDVPSLRSWAERVTTDPQARAAYCEVDGKPHPALLLIHRDTRPQITAVLERGEHKLLPALKAAGGPGLRVEFLTGPDAQQCFANINTPADLEVARRYAPRAQMTGKQPDAS